MADVVRGVQWVQYDEWVVEWTLSWVLTEFNDVSIKVEEVWLEADAVEMEEAGEIATQGLLLVGIEALEICRHHEYQAV